MTDSVRRLVDSARFALSADPLRGAFMIILTVLTGVAPVVTVWATGLTVDAMAQGRTTAAIVGALATLLLAMAWSQLLPPLQTLVENDLGRAVELRAQQRSFDKINDLGGLANFENPEFHDRLRLAVSAGVDVPVQLLTSFTSLVRGGITLVGFAVALFTVDWLAAVLVLIAGVPRLIAETRLGRDRFALQATISPTERLSMMYAALQTEPDAAKEIRLFGLGNHFIGRMITEVRRAQKSTRRLDVRTAKLQSLLELVSLIPVAACLLLLVVRTSQGTLQPGHVVVLLGALAAADGAMAVMATTLARINELSLVITRFTDLMSLTPDIPCGTGRPAPPLQSLEFENVWFRYRPDLPWVLRGMSLRIDAGSAVGVVGLNGAGKSTMIKLMARFYDPERGRVLWNGTDITEFDVESIRQRMGSVFQDFMQYDLSVRENVTLGDVTAEVSDDDVWRVLELVNLAEAVRALPRGLDTVISTMFLDAEDVENPDGAEIPRGSFFSGGQWQRLAIARMLLRLDRDLLVLDEPSSGLDPQAEHDLNDVVRNAARGRARVMVSHRLNTVRRADRVVVLADGRIVEQGTHAELMALEGRYRHLFDLQSSGYVDDVPEGRHHPVPVEESRIGER